MTISKLDGYADVTAISQLNIQRQFTAKRLNITFER